MSYSEAITKNDLKKVLENLGIGTSLSTTVGSFTLNSGWTGDEIEVKQFGDVVMVKGYFTKSGGTGTNEIAIGNISGVSLPTSHVRFRIGAGNAAYNATNSGYGILAKSGQLSVKLSSSQTTVTVELTYIAAHSTGGYKYLIDMFYPVGSYYETSDANFNPNTAWGGTWVKVAGGLIKGEPLITRTQAAPSSDTTVSNTNGVNLVSVQHTSNTGKIWIYGAATIKTNNYTSAINIDANGQLGFGTATTNMKDFRRLTVMTQRSGMPIGTPFTVALRMTAQNTNTTATCAAYTTSQLFVSDVPLKMGYCWHRTA